MLETLEIHGVNDGARTRDNRYHNPGLYQLSYAHHSVDTLQERTCKLFFIQHYWGERRGSNPRQPESQSGTLPTELRSP